MPGTEWCLLLFNDPNGTSKSDQPDRSQLVGLTLSPLKLSSNYQRNWWLVNFPATSFISISLLFTIARASSAVRPNHFVVEIASIVTTDSGIQRSEFSNRRAHTRTRQDGRFQQVHQPQRRTGQRDSAKIHRGLRAEQRSVSFVVYFGVFGSLGSSGSSGSSKI